MNLRKDLGNELKRLRESRNLNQKQLGDLLCYSKSQISRYENGENLPPLEALITYAQEFNVSLDYLIFGTNYQYPPKLEHALKRLDAEEQEKVIEIMEKVADVFYWCKRRNKTP